MEIIQLPDFSLIDFLCDNWALLGIFVGVYLVSRLIVHMDRRMSFLMRLSILLLLLLAIADYVESWTSHFPVYTIWRGLLSALGYTLRPLVLLVLLAMLRGRQKPVVVLPAVINALLCFVSVFTGWVFYFDPPNDFVRGPLGLVPFIAGFFYLGVVLISTSRYFQRSQRESGGLYLFLALHGLLTLLMAITFNRHEIFNVSYAADVLIYYLFLHVQLTKIDSLTELLNRQSYYYDMQNRKHDISGVISIDMNELKQLNDREGHQAGDLALKTISACFLDNTTDRERVYRVGGDEFFVFSFRESEEKLREMESLLREKIRETGYHCSFGSAYRKNGEDPEALCLRADAEMYRDKDAYYESVGQDRRRR